MAHAKQSREAAMKKLEEEFLRKHPGESLFNKDFDPTKGEDVVDLQRISKWSLKTSKITFIPFERRV